MTLLRTALLVTFALALFSSAPREVASAGGALAVIVFPGVTPSVLSADELEAIFTLSKREWPSGQAIIPFNFSPGTGLREDFDRAVLRMGPDEVARFWIDRRIRGGGDAPRKVPSPALMLRVIAKLPGSIGYVPEVEVNKDVKVVARVVGGRVLPPGKAP